MNLTSLSSRKVSVQAFGPILVLGAVVAALSASFLSANQFILVARDLQAYLVSFGVVLTGGCLCWPTRRRLVNCRRKRLVGMTLGLVPMLGLVLVYVGWRYSNQTFMYWMLRSVPASSWAEMGQALRTQGMEALRAGGIDAARVRPSQVNPVLYRLARPEELGYMNVSTRAPGPDGVVIDLACGYKSRTWGLFVGEQRFRVGYRTERVVKVADGVYFFVAARG